MAILPGASYLLANIMNNIFYVYELQYPNSIPFYVGKGKDDRCMKHLKNYDNINMLKQNIINKIKNSNQEPIVKKVAIDLNEETAFDMERFLIAYYGRRDNKTGLLSNLTDGGEGCFGRKMSTSNKKKLVKANTGRKLTKEHCQKLSDAKKGKKQSKEHIEKVKKYLIGRPCSEKTRKKISDANRGMKHSEETKRKMSINRPKKSVNQKTLKGEIISTFNSIIEASNITGTDKSGISKVCKNIANSAGGYIWEFKK